MADFLPLCDLLFNVVSLTAYFCDFLFDILMVYTLHKQGLTVLFTQCITVIVFTSIITQILSLCWYLDCKTKGYSKFTVILLHVLQLGVVWRYACLLIPVQLSGVKGQVRDLCILRLVYGFVQAAPMLLLELSLIPLGNNFNGPGPPRNLVAVSAALSLFSVCWSLASFSKHVQSVDRLILTWLGVVSQLLWRAGTVTARAIALTAYAAVYHSWVLLVLILHWMCMFLWLLSPKGPFHGQQGRKLGMCALIAAVYILAYINLQEKPHSRTMVIFYVIMLLENCLLISAWLSTVWHVRPQNWHLIPILLIVLFLIGICFMLLYYKYFHVKRLLEKPAAPPGVFNCRFAYPDPLYRKKKKPTSFVPPPPTTIVTMPVPFWRRPLPSSSENEGGSSVGSRINIHQKLQEKKEKQLAELKIIEEEIKQGKLVGPEGADMDDHQPIPRTKRHQVEPHLLSLASLNNLASYRANVNRRPPPRSTRSQTPELLLTPRYLYCDCSVLPETLLPSALILGNQHVSDLESQVSLPRSYTLPREFKYYRRHRSGKYLQAVASTNSSDGDVDSVDDESDYNAPQIIVKPFRRQFKYETKL